MKHLLVLQWSANALDDFDRLIEVEDRLVERLSERSDVDGHDAGSGEMNIFIWTDDATEAFAEVERALRGDPMWDGVRVAYRESSGDQYRVLWPRDLREFRVA